MSELVVFSPSADWEPGTKLAKNPTIEVLPLDARTHFAFYRNQSRAGLAYVRHPHFPTYLVPFNEYDEFVLVDKYNEVLRVLTALGASTVDCTSHRARGRALSVRALVKGNGLRGGREARSSSSFDYHHEGSGAAPRDPRPLRWPGEPGIESAIVAVLQNRATSVRITVTRESHLTANAEVAGTLKKVGVDLGLSKGNSQVDTLEFRATFPAQGSRLRSGR